MAFLLWLPQSPRAHPHTAITYTIYVITELYTAHYKYKPFTFHISTLGRQSEKDFRKFSRMAEYIYIYIYIYLTIDQLPFYMNYMRLCKHGCGVRTYFQVLFYTEEIRTHVTISMHVTSSFFSIEWFELRSEVFLPAACLEVFEVSYVAGKYLVLKYAHNAYNLTILHAVTNPSGPSRLQVCYGCLCGLTMLRVWKIYPKTTVYIEVWTYCIQIAQFTYSASRQWTSSSSRRLVLNSFRKTKSGIWYTWDVHVFSTAPVANQIAGEHLRFCPHSKMKSITNGTGNRFQYIGFSDSRNKRSEIVRPHACF